MKIVNLLAALLVCNATLAADLNISNIEWLRDARRGEYNVKFTISWNNAWNNSRNYDAAWIVIKYLSPGVPHSAVPSCKCAVQQAQHAC